MKTALFQRQTIRSALKGWSNLAKLGDHPLTGLRLVANRRTAAGHADTASGRGIALRAVLQEAINRLRPEGETQPDFTHPGWRSYFILQEQFIKGRRARDLRKVMGLSESGYFADQRRALDAVADMLREQEISSAIPEPGLGTPSISTQKTTGHHLPHPSTQFVGRVEEQKKIRHLLSQDECRLISLIGPGGMGKTRLAVEAARQQSTLSAYFVPLEAVETAEQLVVSIAQAVHFEFDSFEANDRSVNDPPQAQLLNFLRGKHLLLLLDNFEHLTQAGSQLVTALMHHAPHLKLLVTSRARLNVRGEWLIDLRGLDLPPADAEGPDPQSYSAGELFVQTLVRVRAGRPLAAKERPAVGEICRLVEGMPLGLELAASWGNMLTCPEIAAEIRHNLDFLQGTFSDLPQRHRSLRAVFSHSWELLTAPEKKVFLSLTVFRGGFDRAAAVAVAQATLPILHGLAGNSLLQINEIGRFEIHELVQQFAAEKLHHNQPAWNEAHARHGRYFAEFLRQRAPHFKSGKKQKEALRQTELELENIRQAWRWALKNGQEQTLIDSIEAIYLFFSMTNRPREGHDILHLVIAHLDNLRPLNGRQNRLLGLAHGILGRFLTLMGRRKEAQVVFKEALLLLAEHGKANERALIEMLAIAADLSEAEIRPEALYERSLAHFEGEQDHWGIANCHLKLVGQWRIGGSPGNHAQQKAVLQLSLENWQKIGDRRGIANTLNYLCDVAYEQGEYADAQQFATRSLAIHEGLGNTIGMAHSLNHLGQVAGTIGRYRDAQRYYQQSLAILRDYGNLREVAVCLDCVGYVSYLLADYKTARQCYEESLTISRDLDDVPGIAWSLHNLGDLARADNRFIEAKRLYFESIRLHKTKDPLSWGGVVALDKLGRVTMALGEREEAEKFFLEALSIANTTGRGRETLDALFNLGRICLARGEVRRAGEILAAVVTHPAVAKETQDAAIELQAQIKGDQLNGKPRRIADLSAELLG
ncbi:MAG: tetratricopeptide repeat protein [Ardenticatenaceae bacterium]|nr:tetratricopeptide repeat protein [Ardenticatenaceae bacterium]